MRSRKIMAFAAYPDAPCPFRLPINRGNS